MTPQRTTDYLAGLVNELRDEPAETEWLEFKHNNAKPDDIGEYLSALANSAALVGKPYGYMIWGIEDDTHDVVGTKFDPASEKVGNELLQNWLTRLLEPETNFRFYPLSIDGKTVILLEVSAAFHSPVSFKGQEFIRIGSYKKNLKDHPEKERALWRKFEQTRFENEIAAERVSGEDVLELINHSSYFDLLKMPQPSNNEAILSRLAGDKIIQNCDAGGWNVTNLGAALLANKLSDFPTVEYKAMRVIRYRGNDRIDTLNEVQSDTGYACGFHDLMRIIMGFVPAPEVIDRPLRRKVSIFPEIAVRELVTNALLHQDLSARGMAPMVEVFDSRLEITNLGVPLIDIQHLVDTWPESRNEGMASLMRRFGIGEVRGSGIDRALIEIEMRQLPAPFFEVRPGATRVVLLDRKPVSAMERDDRIRSCYFHACLRWVLGGHLTNASLRDRFGVKEHNKAAVSRYIREAVNEGLIKPVDEDTSKRQMKYKPFWA